MKIIDGIIVLLLLDIIYIEHKRQKFWQEFWGQNEYN